IEPLPHHLRSYRSMNPHELHDLPLELAQFGKTVAHSCHSPWLKPREAARPEAPRRRIRVSLAIADWADAAAVPRVSRSVHPQARAEFLVSPAIPPPTRRLHELVDRRPVSRQHR